MENVVVERTFDYRENEWNFEMERKNHVKENLEETFQTHLIHIILTDRLPN